MKYVIIYGSKSDSFDSKIELLDFLKKKFDDCLNKHSVRNYFHSNNNIIEIVFGRYDNEILIGIGGNDFEIKNELTKNLYYDIGKYLGCFSKII